MFDARNPAPTQYGYDALDQLQSVTDPRVLNTLYTVNALGSVKQETSPDSGSTNRSFDAAGNLKTSTDARGITATYTYDALNRPLAVSYPTSGENIGYTWDSAPGCTYGIGRLCQVTDSEGSTSFAYDDQGNLLREVRLAAGVNYATQYNYDGANRLLSLMTPSAETLMLTRNSAGRIDSVSATNGLTTTILAKNITYDGTGKMISQVLGNGVLLSTGFDWSGLPASQLFYRRDGDLNGDGVVDVADVALAERIALGLITPTADQLAHGDVAPAGAPDGVIDAADVARILRKALGLETF